ncbi:MAG: acyl--CoA ligase [Deltaproteobacteria bacterium]|nr:acyl--CoA ligase [Deltaproteobacteria bacterium]
MANDMEKKDPESLTTIMDVLRLRAKNTPGALAYSIEGKGITYGRLLDEVLQAASSLVELGIKKGDRCALILPTCLDFIRILYGVQHIGAVPAAVNPGLSPELILRRMQAIACSLAVASGAALEGLKKAAIKGFTTTPVMSPEEIRILSANAARSAIGIDLNDIAYLQFTSGTGGDIKAAVIRHRNLMAHLIVNTDFLGISKEDIFVAWLPLYHDLGLVQFVFGPLYSGCPGYLMQPSILNLPKWLETISRIRGTVTACPDFGYRIAARVVSPDGLDLSSLRIAKNGGEPVRLSTIKHFEQRFGLSGVVLPAYGLAEATLSVTCLPPGEPLRVDPKGNVSCGPPLFDTEIKIVDEKGKRMEPGDTGEILIKGPQIFAGYFNDKKATQQVLKNEWHHTGDLGTLDMDGHLYIFGRKRALIKRAGAIVVPREVEDLADRVEGVRFSAAVGFSPVKDGPEEVVVAAEVRDGIDADGLATITRGIMDEIKKGLGFPPFEIVLVSKGAIPRTPNGKIQYDKLKRLYASGELGKKRH